MKSKFLRKNGITPQLHLLPIQPSLNFHNTAQYEHPWKEIGQNQQRKMLGLRLKQRTKKIVGAEAGKTQTSFVVQNNTFLFALRTWKPGTKKAFIKKAPICYFLLIDYDWYND